MKLFGNRATAHEGNKFKGFSIFTVSRTILAILVESQGGDVI